MITVSLDYRLTQMKTGVVLDLITISTRIFMKNNFIEQHDEHV